VYAARVRVEGRGEWAAGAFVPDAGDGRQEVFGGVVEAHLLGFDGDLYGARAEVKFGKRLRGFRAFGSEAEAAAAVRGDLDEVKRENERFEW
jgi:riboflavin kinase/FMN adenylyltransferase